MTGKYIRYRLVDYYDVWGNEEEGFWVNALCVCEDDIMIAENSTDNEILEYLSKTFGWLSEESVKAGEITIELQDDNWLEIIATNGYPLGRLEKFQ